MAGIITKNLRVYTAEQFKELFSEPGADSVYVFIGRSNPWPDDNNPPTPVDSINTVDYDVWNSLISMKKIQSSDVTFASPRYNWTSGTVYQNYTSTSTFHNGVFFVMTDEYNVYKCMYNNKGAQSTVKPTGRLNTIFSTADGYKWKFMGEIPSSDALKYVTTKFIPVKTLAADDSSYQWLVQQAAANGSIETISVNSAGSNYKYLTGVFNAANSTTVTLPSGANTTNGAYTLSSIYVSSGTGAGQLKKIVNYDGASRVAKVDSTFSTVPSGASFVLSPTVNVSGDGTGLKAYSVVSGGSIDRIEVIDRGANYSRANTTIVANTTTGGSGASLSPNLSPPGGHGKNPVYELYAHNVMLNVKLTGNENGTFFANNDFRVLGVIVNPLLANGSIASASSYLATTTLTKSSGSGVFSSDETIQGATSGAKATFIEYANTTTMIVSNVVGTFQSEVVNGLSSGASATITGYSPNPLTKYSGNVIYIENRSPIVRSNSQVEDIKIIVRF